jgi:hypothetical protein
MFTLVRVVGDEHLAKSGFAGKRVISMSNSREPIRLTAGDLYSPRVDAFVNGLPVKRQTLKSGDQIVLGKTVLEFALKESK